MWQEHKHKRDGDIKSQKDIHHSHIKMKFFFNFMERKEGGGKNLLRGL